MSFACIEQYNGQPTIMIDGKPYPPMAMTARILKHDYLKALGECGIKIYFLMSNTRWLRPGRKWRDENGVEQTELSGIDKFKLDAENLLKAVPDAYIIVRIGMHPPVDWVESHMNDVMQYNDGSHQPAILHSEVHQDLLPGMYSLCSDAWRKDGTKALQEFCDEVDTLPFADRIIGYFLAAGGTSEWYPVNSLELWEKGLYGDFSPAFKHEYSRILKEKYGTEEALRKAWNDPTASFDSPYIPTLEEREYTKIEEKILDAMLNYESADRIIGKQIEMNPAHAGNLGVILNANKRPAVADFYLAWHRGTGNTIIHFAKVIKERYQGKLVGAFYGSYGCTDFYSASTASATVPVLDSGFLDFLAAPGVYNNREPGGYVAQREMQDSFRLRNQMFVVEEDSRTHLENDFYRDAMGLYDITDTIDTLKRDFARNICEDIYAWWFDQHLESGRYLDEKIYQLFKRQSEVARLAYSFDRTKKNEIALIYDQESLHYVSSATDTLMLDYYRTSDLGRIGAPVDYYFHNDMARDNMPDYKLYLMLNAFALTDEERDAIHRKAARNGATVVWLYAPGFINPDRDVKMDNSYIEELTGFRIGRIDNTCSPRFKLVGKHPALRYGDMDRRYGYIDRDVHSNVWLGSTLSPPFANPCFYIDDPEAEILGRYCNNGKDAFGMKRFNGFTSVYCAPQILRSELIASLAEYSGCHLFTHNDDCIYANENFVTIHAKDTGRRTIYFKQACSPYEVYEQRYYGNNVTSIEVDMRLGETLMFCIQDISQQS
jgi:hypothetical protein